MPDYLPSPSPPAKRRLRFPCWWDRHEDLRQRFMLDPDEAPIVPFLSIRGEAGNGPDRWSKNNGASTAPGSTTTESDHGPSDDDLPGAVGPTPELTADTGSGLNSTRSPTDEAPTPAADGIDINDEDEDEDEDGDDTVMDDFVSESDSDYTSYWRDWFISSRGNEYFCEIDEDYLTDRFNLTGLNTEVQYYQYALDLVTDVFDLDCDDEMRETIEKSARHLYGLVHARYIVTTRGLAKMLEKYKKADFGKCPRVMCNSHPLLPMGLSDIPNLKPVKLYCARCEDTYNPKSSRHATIDGAYFGTSFHNILFQVYPALIPAKSAERYTPRVYGFKVHAGAALIRWQNSQRDEMRRRLRKMEVESGFKDDSIEDEPEDEDEDEELDFEEGGQTGLLGQQGDVIQ